MYRCDADQLAGAFAGMANVGSDESLEARWQDAVSSLHSRHSGTVAGGSVQCVRWSFRGHQSSCFQGEQSIVILDGWVECPDRLIPANVARPDTGHETQAAQVALAYERGGESVLAGLEGQFALVIVERATGEVLLVRDKFGTKPLYYARNGSSWAWASESKCLMPFLSRISVDPDGLRQAVQFRYVLERPLLSGVEAVSPACHVRLRQGRAARETQYWSLEFQPDARSTSLDDWADRVDDALGTSLSGIAKRSPDVGILLSGGVDSSLLALRATQAGFRKCVAYTAKWRGDNPELEAAAAVARHLGIEHRIVDLDDKFIADAFPWLVWRLEEPPRHYNSLVLARLFEAAAGQVGTLLSGHMADALFGPTELAAVARFIDIHRFLRPVAPTYRNMVARLIPGSLTTRSTRWKTYLSNDEHSFMQRYFRIRYGVLGKRVFGVSPRDVGLSRPILGRFYVPSDPVVERFQRLNIYSFNQSHMALFDRCGTPMGVPVSMPFISREIVEIARRLPTEFKADGQVAKPVLKRLASRHFPSNWIYRRKQGFPTQTVQWLNGPLVGWRRLLQEERTASRGLVDTRALTKASVSRDFEAIWTAMSLETYCRQFIDGEGGPPSPHT